MAKGYHEMAAINLEEANAGVAADNQAEEITEKFVSGSMNE
ncbi:hypothetical protein QKW52_22500 [Bacillus sonorensis]|nr:hypothetical protein [Bacillus sonorensis]